MGVGMRKQVGRQQLLDRATELFRAKGYAGTSIDEVVRACGITKGSLYHHFRGKDALVLAVLEQLHGYYQEHIFSQIMSVKEPGMQALRDFNAAIEAFFLSHPDGCLFANLSLEGGARHELLGEPIRRFFEAWRCCYATVFSMRYTADEARALAEEALAAVQGAILMFRIEGDPRALRRVHGRLLTQCDGSSRSEGSPGNIMATVPPPAAVA